MARKKRYDRVAPDSPNEFLYGVWRRQARKAHAKFDSIEALNEALERGEIEVEKLPRK
jgi:hypothetical protein